MRNCNYGLNSKPLAISCSLVAVYDSIVQPGDINNHSAHEPLLFCAINTFEGNGNILLKDGIRITLDADTFFFGKYSDIYAFVGGDTSWHYHCYWFSISGFELTLNKPVKNTSGGDDEFINEIIGLLKENSPYSVMLANSMMLHKLIVWKGLFKEYENKHEPKVLAEIKKYINLNIDNDLKLSELAQNFNYCEKHIRNLFKKHTGFAPKEYINNAKLEKAANLLTTTSWSINEISSMLSFSSPYHFSSNFKKHFSVTPTKYRKSAQAPR